MDHLSALEEATEKGLADALAFLPGRLAHMRLEKADLNTAHKQDLVDDIVFAELWQAKEQILQQLVASGRGPQDGAFEFSGWELSRDGLGYVGTLFWHPSTLTGERDKGSLRDKGPSNIITPGGA